MGFELKHLSCETKTKRFDLDPKLSNARRNGLIKLWPLSNVGNYKHDSPQEFLCKDTHPRGDRLQCLYPCTDGGLVCMT